MREISIEHPVTRLSPARFDCSANKSCQIILPDHLRQREFGGPKLGHYCPKTKKAFIKGPFTLCSMNLKRCDVDSHLAEICEICQFSEFTKMSTTIIRYRTFSTEKFLVKVILPSDFQSKFLVVKFGS